MSVTHSAAAAAGCGLGFHLYLYCANDIICDNNLLLLLFDFYCSFCFFPVCSTLFCWRSCLLAKWLEASLQSSTKIRLWWSERLSKLSSRCFSIAGLAVACLGIVVSYKKCAGYSCCFKQLLLACLQFQSKFNGLLRSRFCCFFYYHNY